LIEGVGGPNAVVALGIIVVARLVGILGEVRARTGHFRIRTLFAVRLDAVADVVAH
jgi:hypothetical protein